MARQHHLFSGHEAEQILGDSEGPQGTLHAVVHGVTKN